MLPQKPKTSHSIALSMPGIVQGSDVRVLDESELLEHTENSQVRAS